MWKEAMRRIAHICRIGTAFYPHSLDMRIVNLGSGILHNFLEHMQTERPQCSVWLQKAP